MLTGINMDVFCFCYHFSTEPKKEYLLAEEQWPRLHAPLQLEQDCCRGGIAKGRAKNSIMLTLLVIIKPWDPQQWLWTALSQYPMLWFLLQRPQWTTWQRIQPSIALMEMYTKRLIFMSKVWNSSMYVYI